jgi:hypothetical protein
MEEIAHVMSSSENHIIIIDDARYFLKPPSSLHISKQWPGLNEIVPALMKKPNYYTFVSEDVIVSAPETVKELLIPYFKIIHQNEFPGSGIMRNLKFAMRNVVQKWKA